MATLPAGSRVELSQAALHSLQYPPPAADLVVIVHDAALRAPRDKHTQVAHIVNGAPVWIGALGEDLVAPVAQATAAAAREFCAARLLVGARLWDVVRPGSLLRPGVARPLSTVYDGSDLRPWVIIGETDRGAPIAAPLNDPRGNPKWWTPTIAQTNMSFPGNNKDAQVELAHLWTLPSGIAAVGRVLPAGAAPVETAIRDYFGMPRA